MQRSFILRVAAVALAIGAGTTQARADYSYVALYEIGKSWFAVPYAEPWMNGPANVTEGPGGVGALGTDSLHMHSGDSQAKTRFVTFDYAGTKLRDITGLSYQDYRYWGSAGASRRISISIDVDHAGDGSSLTALVFEPANQAGGAGALLYNTWQSWDAYKDGAAIWWSTNAIPGVCASSCFVSWQAILAANPNAKVSASGGFGFNIGPGWSGSFDGAADGLTIRTTAGTDIYDFHRLGPFPTMRSAGLTVFDNSWDPAVRNIVGVVGDPAPGFSRGSFASNGIGTTELIFYPFFDREVVLGEVASMSYWSKKESTHSAADPRDWLLNIYTKPHPGQAGSSPFGMRIGAEPYVSQNLVDPVNTWNQWTTDGPDNRLRFHESTYGLVGSFAAKSWDQFVGGMSLAGARGPGVPYATQPILYFSLQTESAWAPGFVGQVDGLRIELFDGTEMYVDFEATDVIPLTLTGSASPRANAFGWNNTSVTVSFTCTDNAGGTGLAPNNFTGGSGMLTQEGANQSLTFFVSCTDLQGNVAAPATVSGINIDKTAPTFPACWAFSFPYSSGTRDVSISANDALSGIDTAGSTLTGTVDTNVVGTTSVLFTAKDKAGNISSQSCNYTVLTMSQSIQSVLVDLQAFLTPPLPKPLSDKVTSATAHLTKSLNAKYWIDGTHLTKDGRPAFDEVKAAVHALEEVNPPMGVTSNAIDALVAADRALAQMAIGESSKNPTDVQKANSEIAKGDADRAAGKFEEAVGHYKNAWDLAT